MRMIFGQALLEQKLATAGAAVDAREDPIDQLLTTHDACIPAAGPGARDERDHRQRVPQRELDLLRAGLRLRVMHANDPAGVRDLL